MNLTGQRLFFLGVGGMGMLPLALFAREGGAMVEGYDDGLTPRAERILRAAGVVLHESLSSSGDFDRVVVSSAIRKEHPVLKTLLSGGKSPQVCRRGEFLAEIAKDYRLLAVAGSHGKTTTTAILAHLAVREKWSADFVIGGLPEGGFPAARNRNSEWLIAEIDESDGTIEGFSPEVTLFLNFDWDHADRYKTPEEIRCAWLRLAERTTGTVVFPESLEVGLGSNPDSGQSALQPNWTNVERRLVFPVLPGGFLRQNSSAAETAFFVATGRESSQPAIEGFPGVWRRQTFHGRSSDFVVIEDYAHHPREVFAFLEWLFQQDLPQPIRVFFQPHRFSRTTRFVEDFVEVLRSLDEVFLHSIYGAGETVEEGRDPLQSIRRGLEEKGVRVNKAERLEDFPPLAGTFAFVGAGDANEWAPVLTALESSPTAIAALASLARTTLSQTELREEEPLSRYTTMRIGGPAALFARPGNLAELRWLLRTAQLFGVPIAYLGNGSNLLVCDKGFAGMVIHLDGNRWEEVHKSEDGRTIVAGAGISMPKLARWAAEQGIAGFSFCEGVPGTVGGGVRMNAGSMGGWIGDRVNRVDAVDYAGRLISLDASQLTFGYRSCPQLEGLCIIRVFMTPLGTDTPEVIREEMREFASRRRSSQPGGPSAGCLFRNPDGDSAGRLLEEAGLKGFSVGRVRISDIHANFISPQNGSTAEEVIAVMENARRRVRDQFGIELEPEIKFLGREGFLSPFSSMMESCGKEVR